MPTTAENLISIIQQLTLLEVDIRDLHASNLALNTEVAATLNLKVAEVAAAIAAFNSDNLAGLTDKGLARANLGLVDPEKGNWIPNLGGAEVLAIQTATWEDDGTYIDLWADFIVTSAGAIGTGDKVFGQPFACGNSFGHVDITYWTDVAQNMYALSGLVEKNDNVLIFRPQLSISQALGGGVVFKTGTRVIFHAKYKKA